MWENTGYSGGKYGPAETQDEATYHDGPNLSNGHRLYDNIESVRNTSDFWWLRMWPDHFWTGSPNAIIQSNVNVSDLGAFKNKASSHDWF
jgi:hypothetical protein